MVKTSLKDKYLGGKTPTALQNEVATFRNMYYDKVDRVMINQSTNDFYIRFVFKIDALLQEVGLLLDIVVTFFKNMSPDVRELLISEGVQVPPILPT